MSTKGPTHLPIGSCCHHLPVPGLWNEARTEDVTAVASGERAAPLCSWEKGTKCREGKEGNQHGRAGCPRVWACNAVVSTLSAPTSTQEWSTRSST